MKYIISESQYNDLKFQRRKGWVMDIFYEIISDIDFFEFGDEEDFHNHVVHEVVERISNDLDSYNEYYDWVDNILTKPIMKVWKQNS